MAWATPSFPSGGAAWSRARSSASRQSPALKIMPSSHSRASPAPAYTTVHLAAQPMPQNRPLKNRGRIYQRSFFPAGTASQRYMK